MFKSPRLILNYYLQDHNNRVGLKKKLRPIEANYQGLYQQSVKLLYNPPHDYSMIDRRDRLQQNTIKLDMVKEERIDLWSGYYYQKTDLLAETIEKMPSLSGLFLTSSFFKKLEDYRTAVECFVSYRNQGYTRQEEIRIIQSFND